MNPLRSQLATLASLVALAALALPSQSFAQKKVPGEKWRQTVSMEASGMKMPARTVEVCVPVGKAEEALARPPENEDCKMSDVQRAGNKFSANMKCTGKTPIEGHIEMTTEGNRTIGKMQMQMQGMTMNMNTESTKLGTACEATDWSDYKPPVVAAAAVPAAVDICAQFSDRMKKSPGDVHNSIAMYVGKDAQCAKHASFKTFCSSVETPAGFEGLAEQERGMASVEDRSSIYATPLTSSMQACGLGTGKAGIDALRTRLLVVAEKDGAWDFLVKEGNDATYAMLTATAKRECSGRSFTNAVNSRYGSLCRNYGMALARGDKAAVQQAAGVYTESGGGAAAPAAAVPAAAGAPAAGSATPEEASKNKTQETIQKGKQKLRSIFGGGG